MRMHEDSSMEAVSARVEWLRNELGMNQKQFSNSLGISIQQYNNWKSCRQRLPLDGALQINATYGTSLDFLYLGRVDMLPNHLYNAWLDHKRVAISK